MNQPNWVSVPLGPDAGRWITRRTTRKVLVGVHTMVAGQRLLDVVGLIESDRRIQVVYTQGPATFSGGVSLFLRAIGALEIPWDQAIRERFDLALVAAPGGIEQIHAPVVMLPHGAGRAKRERRAEGGAAVERAIHALGPEHLIRAGRVVPACVVLSHDAQREILLRQCPQAAGVALVAGDPCYDILRASLAWRRHYREALDVPPDRKLVLAASTWGPHSLFERHQDLLASLLRQLDPRHYRVAAMLHPAAWFGHGLRQVRAWLTEERAAGLLLIAPEEDWRGVVVAADYVIGDHGSATAYAAAIGKPVMHTDLAMDEIDASSAQAFIGTRAPRLLLSRPLEPQLRHAGRTLPPTWGAEVTGRLTSCPGQAHSRLREAMYRLLELDVPGRHRAIEPAPLPRSWEEARHA